MEVFIVLTMVGCTAFGAYKMTSKQ